MTRKALTKNASIRNAPSKGDIVLLDFNPQSGHEQAGSRPGLVISSKDFNSRTGFAFICPVTSQVKGYPFEVAVEGAKKTKGVILADQMKSLDWLARNVKSVDCVSPACVQQVVALVGVILYATEA